MESHPEIEAPMHKAIDPLDDTDLTALVRKWSSIVITDAQATRLATVHIVHRHS